MKGIYKQINLNYGIVTDENDTEYFIFKNYRNNAFSGDFVEIKITKEAEENKKPEAKIIEIISRTKEPLVGIFIKNKNNNYGFVKINDTFYGKDIFISKENQNLAKNNDVVLVKIIGGMEKPSGKIIKIVGQKNQKGIEELMVLYSNGINLNFSDNVKNEAGKLKFNIDKNIRKDLKNEFIITIDGEDAKDLDDAIGVKKLPNGNYELGVHIADVSHYVKEGGFLDKEALLRGTSIYLPDRVIPMLPNELSNNLCSLNPNEPKFTLSAILEIGKDGKIIKRKVEETLIKSKARMTYNEVAEILKGKECSKQLKEIITNSYDLYKIIYKRRKIEGKVEFDFGETKIKIGKNGEVVDVFKIQRNDAHKIIEEFMIIANEEVSKIFSELKIPFLYRTHEKPSLADMEKLKDILLPYSIKLNTNNVSSLEISHIIDSLKGKPYEYSVSKQILKAMAKAKYLPFAIGHFGLSLKYYSHFTSPIRRYPDLQIHRIIKEYLHGNLPKDKIKLYTSQLGRISKQCSKNEEKAEEIENKINFLKIIEFMQNKIGEKFNGIISGLSPIGFYVELENGIEGFVNIKILGRDFLFNNEKNEWGKRGGKNNFYLGKKVKIQVIKADKKLARLDFDIIST